MASTAAAAAARSTDRLSDLPDDILKHILSFAPSREAARATALSRRWRRPLWLDAGAVNVDYRSYAGVPDRRRALDDADHAYASLCSRGRAPKRLSVVMPHDAIVCAAAGSTDDEDYEIVDYADGVEDPRLEWLRNGGLPRCTLPFAVLRVLELTGYDLEPYADVGRRQLAFPRLEAMRLRWCRTKLATLQAIISAAPRLADVRLESLTFTDQHYEYTLRCEAATVIAIENCGVLDHSLLHRDGCKVRLDAPDLCRLRYAHTTAFDDHTSFSFEWSQPLELDHVHLELHSSSPAARNRWRSILSDVLHVRYLKLTAYAMADLDLDLGPQFRDLERLEIEELCGWSVLNHGAAARAVVKLLRKCPSLVELRVKFSWRKYLRDMDADPAEEMAAIADFSPCGSVDGDDDEADCCEASEDLHGKFCCRKTVGCLRRVVVEFDADELTCFQVRLVKFLAKSAVDLVEFVVDGGKGYDSSRIHRKVARWQERWRPPPPPLWPPPLSEFPLLEAPPTTSDGEVYYDEGGYSDYMYSTDEEEEEEDDEEEDDVSPRHYMHNGSKKKKRGIPECFSVKPMARGFIAPPEWSRPGTFKIRRRCRYRRSYWEDEDEEEDVAIGSPLDAPTPPSVPVSASSPAEPWKAPLLYEFPPLRRAPPPASGRPPLRRAPPPASGRPSLRRDPPPASGRPSPPHAARRSPSRPAPPLISSETFSALLRALNTNFPLGCWRDVSLADLGVDVAASRERSRSHRLLHRRRRSPPAAFCPRFASSFPGRSSRTMRRH